QVLYVVSVLVRDDIRVGKLAALRAETRMQLVEEADIQVDLLVGRAVEGAVGGLRQTTLGLGRARIQDRVRRRVLDAAVRQLVTPVRLDAVDDAYDQTVRAGIRIGAGAALLGDARSRHLHAVVASGGAVGRDAIGRGETTAEHVDGDDDQGEHES